MNPRPVAISSGLAVGAFELLAGAPLESAPLPENLA